MPPARRLTCAYVEGGRRCRRAGSGNPPICAVHKLALESEAVTPERPGARLGKMIARVLRGQRISDDVLHAGLEDLVDVAARVASERPASTPGTGAPWWAPNMAPTIPDPNRERRREPRRDPPRQERRKKASTPPAEPDPRIVLGFAAGQKVTAEEVKKRHRELARKHHPDRGGSLAKMQEINAAVDQIMASL